MTTVALAAITGCAGWVEDDTLSIDDGDEGAADLRAVYGYRGTPLEDGIEDDDVEPEFVEVARGVGQGVRGETASLAPRRRGPVCTLTSHRATVTPRLTRDEIAAVIGRHTNEIRACYNRALWDDATIAGRATLHMVIAEDGRVARTQVQSTDIEHASLHRCIASKASAWTFPTPPGTGRSIVHYPYVFAVRDARVDPDRLARIVLD